LQRKLLLATGNPGKIREYSRLLASVPFDLVTPAALGITLEVAETGATFEENARLKAEAFARASGLLTLADDSGLVVDVLGGEPGTRSRRLAGENATDAERVQLLLARLKGIAWEARTARFRCVIALAEPGRETIICRGECPGIITTEPRGSNGFGYDPVFYLPLLGRTMAELTAEEKNRLSHRGLAVQEAADILRRLAEEG